MLLTLHKKNEVVESHGPRECMQLLSKLFNFRPVTLFINIMKIKEKRFFFLLWERSHNNGTQIDTAEFINRRAQSVGINEFQLRLCPLNPTIAARTFQEYRDNI